MNPKKSTQLTHLEVSLFCNQMALILQAGISSYEGLSIMLEESKTPEEQHLLQQMLSALTETGSLHEALLAANVFPSYMLQMIQIGEQTGKLDEVMLALSLHYERENNIAKSIKSAITYPLIMIGMMFVIILVLIVKVMPIFNQVFLQLGQELSGFSLAIMNMGTTVSHFSILFVMILCVIIGAILYYTKFPKGKAALARLGHKISFTRKLFDEVSACRFAGGMAMTLSSGLNAEESLTLVHNLTDDQFKDKIETCSNLLTTGTDLSSALTKSQIFTGNYARMALIGDKTGTLDEVMKKIATQYEDHINERINKLIGIIEPTLVIFLSIIVGVILLSVMLPLLGVLSAL